MSFPEKVLLIKEGDLSLGIWGFTDFLMCQGDDVVELNFLQTCTIVSDRHEAYQTGIGRMAGGIIGGILLGPVGAAGGLLAGGKRRIDETIILCRLFDGRTFTAECSQLTAAKFTQIANSNLITYASNSAQTDSIPSISLTEATVADDTIECPMCAESIKRKAKICRYCNYKIAEERDARIGKIISDIDTEQLYSFTDLYSQYVKNVGYTDIFSESEVRLILNSFVKFHLEQREATYRNIVGLVKEELGLSYKTHLLDLFREGFSFVRTNKKFIFISEDDLIVVCKSQW